MALSKEEHDGKMIRDLDKKKKDFCSKIKKLELENRVLSEKNVSSMQILDTGLNVCICKKKDVDGMKCKCKNKFNFSCKNTNNKMDRC